VTGIDCSRRSIDYARAQAEGQRLPITYAYGNYVEVPYPQGVDAVVLIYGDLCVLAPAQRDIVLRKVCAALKPAGYFVCDVTTTRARRRRAGVRTNWEVLETGFWRPSPHLVLTQGFDYPADSIWVDQFVVVTADGAVTVYRNWFQDYALETITPTVEAAGFDVQAVWSDLAGTPYDAEAEWIGIAARKR
jgi:SAM-dependent methyltransferase